MQYYISVEAQVTYGLDTILTDRTVEIGLGDLVFGYKMLEEFNHFLHQPHHYPTVACVRQWFGDAEHGAYALLHHSYYRLLGTYLPADIRSRLGWETAELVNPDPPYYHKPCE